MDPVLRGLALISITSDRRVAACLLPRARVAALSSSLWISPSWCCHLKALGTSDVDANNFTVVAFAALFGHICLELRRSVTVNRWGSYFHNSEMIPLTKFNIDLALGP